MVVVVETFHGRVLDRSVHPLDLAIRPRMLHLCQPVLDCMLAAHAVKDMFEGTCIAASVCKLDAVIGQHRVQPVRNSSNQVAQELGGGHLPCLLNELGYGELARPVNANEDVELAFSGLHLCDVDMEIANGIAFEALPFWLVAFNIRQA
ncbi:hypothetical protein ROG8370_03985 [Roseovarius gaetbuli]|uniref:Uncharacterized protein n=1 Tax=Roseovarius gaetbuli TaxID=1356575 RepID=A0A1X7ADY3_9RHOB|nr:hypothetical protein ROG8370_03985 [Roseovarius gaetbuli]